MSLTAASVEEKFRLIAAHLGVDLSTQDELDAAAKAEADADKGADKAAAKDAAKADKAA